MAEDLAARVGALEALVEQIATTQVRQVDLLERMVRVEERQNSVTTTVARLESEVRENARGVGAASPWLSVARTFGTSFMGAIATACAAYVAVRFGLPKG